MRAFLVTLLAASPALAEVTQTDAVKTPLPQPVNTAEHNVVDSSFAWNATTQVIWDAQGQILNQPLNYGDFYAPPAYPQFVTGDAITLAGLFKWRKDAVDPTKDATTGPGYISGKCGFSAELLLLGGNCQAKLGWYNVPDAASHTPPPAAEIYPLIGVPHEALHCVESDGTTAKKDGFCPLAWDNRGPYNLSIVRWTPAVFSSGDLSQDPRYKGGLVAFALIGDPQKCPQNKYSMYEHNQRNADGTPWVTTLLYQSKLDPNGLYIAFEDLPMSPADWKKSGSTSGGADGDFNDYVVYISRSSCPGDVDAACVGKSCPSGQTCKLGACVDPCAGVMCSGNTVCVDGACSSPSGVAGAGAGGAGTLSFGGRSSAEAGEASGAEAGEGGAGATPGGGAAGDDGATPAAGGAAQGGTSGATPPGGASQTSSGCGYAALTSRYASGAWSALGLAFGLAALRRRRHARRIALER